MKLLGNLIWILFGGFLIALLYFIVGLVMCVTIIGIPFGVQLMKLGAFVLWPFGRDLVDKPSEPGCLSVLMNVIWIFTGWWKIAVGHLFFGLLCCITVIGIPFGLQHFKLAKASLTPFSKEIK